MAAATRSGHHVDGSTNGTRSSPRRAAKRFGAELSTEIDISGPSTSSALLAGLGVRLAQRLGRVAADGLVGVTMPVDDRAPGHPRANAITNVDFTVDPPT